MCVALRSFSLSLFSLSLAVLGGGGDAMAMRRLAPLLRSGLPLTLSTRSALPCISTVGVWRCGSVARNATERDDGGSEKRKKKQQRPKKSFPERVADVSTVEELDHVHRYLSRKPYESYA